MAEPTGDKSKLIIDEDWKTQVEREREEMRRAKEQELKGEQAGGSPESDVEQPSAVKRPDRPEEQDEIDRLPPPPPATFPFLVSMLGSQALVAMGQLGEESGGELRMDYAKHYIDLLGLLEEKTKGNLTDEESSLLFDWLHQLRLGFVELAKRK